MLGSWNPVGHKIVLHIGKANRKVLCIVRNKLFEETMQDLLRILEFLTGSFTNKYLQFTNVPAQGSLGRTFISNVLALELRYKNNVFFLVS